MHHDWKVFTPSKNVEIHEFVSCVYQLIKKFPSAYVQLTSTKESRDEIEQVCNLRLANLESYGGTISANSPDEYINFINSNQLVDYTIFSNGTASKSDDFGFRINKKNHVDALSLNIELPYANKANSIEKLNLLLGYLHESCLLYTSPSPRDRTRSRMPSSA